MKILRLLLLTAAAVVSIRAQGDSATVLARILAEKGTISAPELARVQAAQEQQKLAVLANILQSKGVLNNSDLARLSLPAIPAAQPPGAEAVTMASAPAPVPAPAKQESAVTPVTTRKHFPVSLYGTLLFTAGYNTADFNYEDLPFIASKQGSDPTGGDKNFYETARESRLGLRLDPVDTLGGKLSGDFEFDMMGGEAPYANGIGMNLFRMRLAYGRIDWSNVSLEAGQDWSVFAPLNPTSLNQFGIPELTATGNPWSRQPQLRVETKTDPRSGNTLLWQFAAADPDMGDYSTSAISAARQPGIGERGRMPDLESRLAWTRNHDDRDFTVGLSAQYGRGKNAGTIGTHTVQSPVDSWGVALDYSLPFSKFFNITGEAFEGRALGMYTSATGEAIGAVGTIGAHGVESRGGWLQGQFNFNKQWQSNLMYGIDAPDAHELPVGNRSRNQSYIANIIYKMSMNVNLSVEYRRILTDYRNQLAANERGDHIDLGIAYLF